MLSLHAEACPELNGNSEGDVSCAFSFTAALPWCAPGASDLSTNVTCESLFL